MLYVLKKSLFFLTFCFLYGWLVLKYNNEKNRAYILNIYFNYEIFMWNNFFNAENNKIQENDSFFYIFYIYGAIIVILFRDTQKYYSLQEWYKKLAVSHLGYFTKV